MKKAGSIRIIILYVLSIVAIFYVVLRNIEDLQTITIISDEFGYWYAGSVFAGKDWREVAYLNPYYGFGYGFLLAPLFLLFDNSILMYQIAIGYNAVFLGGSFLLSVKIWEKLQVSIKKEWCILISLVVSLYSNLVFQSQTTQVECFLNFLFWLSLYCLVNVIQKSRYIDCVTFALVGGYMYMVHMRSLGVIVASVLLIIGMGLLKKLPVKKVIVYLCVVLAMFIGTEGIKGALKDYTYAPLSEYSESNEEVEGQQNIVVETEESEQELGGMSKVNDYSGIFESLGKIFSVEGIKKLFVNLVGRFYYLFAASMFIMYFAFVRTTGTIKKSINQIQEKELLSDGGWVTIYLLLCMVFAMVISSIFLLDYSRQDMIVYGRYMEYVIAPLLAVGIFALFEKQITFKIFYIGCIIQFILGLIVEKVIVTSEMKSYLDNNAVGLVNKIIDACEKLGATEYAIKILMAVFLQGVLIVVLAHMKRAWSKVAILLLCVFVWIDGGDAVYEHNTVEQQERLEKTVGLGDYLTRKSGEENIYYLNESTKYLYIDYMQFQLPNKAIKVISLEDLEGSIKQGYYLVNKSSKTFKDAVNDSELVGECKHFKLYHVE